MPFPLQELAGSEFIRDAKQMMGFLADNPEFEVLYGRAVDMMADRSELMKMFESYFDNEDVIASMNMTNESIIRRLEKQLREQDDKYSEQIHVRDKQLREQSVEIERLKRELAEAKSEETAQ